MTAYRTPDKKVRWADEDIDRFNILLQDGARIEDVVAASGVMRQTFFNRLHNSKFKLRIKVTRELVPEGIEE